MKRSWLLLTAITAVLSLSVYLAGCGSDDGSGPNGGGSTDTTPPGVDSVTAIDFNHVEVAFDEQVKKSSAERRENYTIVELPTPSAPEARGLPRRAVPGDTIPVGTAVLGTDGRTVTLTTLDLMNTVPYGMSVRRVEDLQGNRIETEVTSSFAGVNTPDVTPPQIVYRSPSDGETGVGTSQPVVVQFSEFMDVGSVFAAVTWTHGGGNVSFSPEADADNTFRFVPSTALATNTTYTFSIAAIATDIAGNNLAAASWTFTTRPTPDTTRPTLLSSSPGNGQTNVPLDANIRLTFSEPIIRNLEEVQVFPEIGNGTEDWQDGDATIVFDPDDPFPANTQYTITIPPNGVRDLSGNGIAGLTTITFTTGSVLASGRITGVVSGDPQSNDAQDPTGTAVVAFDTNPFVADGNIVGGTFAGSGGAYSIANLPDGTYWPIGVLDSNGDGEIDPSLGDAIGAYGADIAQGDLTPVSITITGGNSISTVNFPLYDTVAIVGDVTYIGTDYAGGNYRYFVAVFDTTAFDTTGGLPSPLYVTDGDFIMNRPQFSLNELDNGLVDGTYYVGAFLDANDNFTYDPATDPAGIYQIGGQFAPVTVENGSDALGITVVMEDVGAAASAPSWRAAAGRPSGRARVGVRIRDALTHRE